MTRHSFIILILSLLAAFTYGFFVREWVLHDAPDAARVALKTLPVALLALVSISERGRIPLTAALALGALGDGLLAVGGATWFIAGAAAFLLGHACYIYLFIKSGAGWGAVRSAPRVLLIVATYAAAAAALYLLWPADASPAPGVLIYTLALTTMVATTFTLPWERWLAMLGAVLFLISDILLTVNTNRPPMDENLGRVISDSGWFTYYFGQLFLLLGALPLRLRT